MMHKDAAALKAKLRLAFADLRKKGIAAKANFGCCMSCATAEAPQDRPMVYYHRQDFETINERGVAYIRYCSPNGLHLQTVAKAAVDAMMAHGLVVAWNGCTDTAIIAGLAKKQESSC